MAHVCYDCKLGYGHPLSWCPGCGRPMKNVSVTSWDKLRENNWKLEGDKQLYEYFINGQQIKDKPYETLVQTIKNKYPVLWELFELGDYDGTGTTPVPKLKFDIFALNRTVSIVLKKDDDITMYIHNPCLRYRLVGSDLEVGKISNYTKDLERLDESRI